MSRVHFRKQSGFSQFFKNYLKVKENSSDISK